MCGQLPALSIVRTKNCMRQFRPVFEDYNLKVWTTTCKIERPILDIHVGKSVYGPKAGISSKRKDTNGDGCVPYLVLQANRIRLDPYAGSKCTFRIQPAQCGGLILRI